MAWSMIVLQQAMDLLLTDPRYVQSNQTRKGMLRDKLASLVNTLFDGHAKDLPTIEEAAGAVLGATLGAPTTRNRSRRYVSPSISPTPRSRQTVVAAAADAQPTTYSITDDDDDDNENHHHHHHHHKQAAEDPFDAEIRRLLFVDVDANDNDNNDAKKKRVEKKKKTKEPSSSPSSSSSSTTTTTTAAASAVHDDDNDHSGSNSSSSSNIDLRGVFMTLKDDTQALERFALACGDRARARRRGRVVAGVGAGAGCRLSEADREACRILTQVQKGLRMARCALDKVSLPGTEEGEVWVKDAAERTTLVLPEVMELD